MARTFGKIGARGFTGYTVTGIPQVVRNIERAIAGIETRSRAAMEEVGLVVKADALKRTPVDTGHLRASAYVQVTSNRTAGVKARGGWQSVVEIGYTAAYAPYVHEINKNYRIGSWKFLEFALRDNEAKIVEIIKSRAQIRGGMAA